MAKAKGDAADSKPLGTRVHNKHRKMLAALKRKVGYSHAKSVRLGIEELYAQHCTKVA